MLLMFYVGSSKSYVVVFKSDKDKAEFNLISNNECKETFLIINDIQPPFHKCVNVTRGSIYNATVDIKPCKYVCIMCVCMYIIMCVCSNNLYYNKHIFTYSTALR